MSDPSPSPLAGESNGPAEPGRRGLWRVLVATWNNAGKNNLDLIAAGVAFYAFLAFVPLLTALVLSYGLVAEPASVVRHVETLTEMLPEDAASLIGGQLQSMARTNRGQTGLALALAIGLAVYGASKGAGSTITALDIVYDTEETRGFVRRTALALTMTTGGVVVMILAIFSVSTLKLLTALLPDLGLATQLLIAAAPLLLAGAAMNLLLAIVYRFGPNRPGMRWRWITPGSALASLVWLAATAGFGAYVANFANYNATYGSLGAIIVFLTWLYLSAYIVLFGAELNAVLERGG